MLLFRFVFCVFTIALSFPISLFGQSQAEQLKIKLSTAKIAEKPAIYNQLSQIYLETNTNKSLEHAANALSAAIEAKDISSEAAAYINVGLATRAISKSYC
jgi:hypothetical protein